MYNLRQKPLWVEANRDVIREKRKQYTQQHHVRLGENLRTRLIKVVNACGTVKTGHTFDLLGCSLLQFEKFIESQFHPGMAWNGERGWDIDHVIPIKLFNLQVPFQQRVCFSWTNLRPLWRKDNRIKSSNFECDTVQKHLQQLDLFMSAHFIQSGYQAVAERLRWLERYTRGMVKTPG